MFDKVIFHIDLDAFFASVEQLLTPELRGQPVIVKGPGEHRTVVSAASYEAREYGVRSAMPVAQARRLCPHGRFVTGRSGVYADFSEQVFKISRTFTPLVEPASIDEGYLDMTGMERLYVKRRRVQFWPICAAQALKNAVKEKLGLNVSVGIGSNKLIAKIASNYAKPNGIACIRAGSEAAFLKPLEAKVLPGIGRKSLACLASLGVRTVGDMQKLPVNLLKGVFGVVGEDFYYLAHGLGSDTIEDPVDPKSISRGTTFEADTWDLKYVKDAMRKLVKNLSREMRRLGFMGKLVTVRLRYSDFSTVSRCGPMDQFSNHDHEIHRQACRLFDKLYSRRLPIRLVCVGVSNLTAQAGRQMSLWEKDDFNKYKHLYRAMDTIRDRYGEKAVGFAQDLDESYSSNLSPLASITDKEA